MENTIMENTGERFIPSASGPYEIRVNVERYLLALPHCKDKNVLELGCGCGLGTYMYSLVAKSLVAVDYSEEGLAYANSYPWDPAKVRLERMDLTVDVPKERFDVVVATEFLEHIDDPATLLAKLNTERIIFSFPFDSLQMSDWHRYPIRSGESGLKDIADLMQKSYIIEEMKVQDKKWVFGIAKKK